MSVHLVTGGAGFIGSHLVEALLAEGHRVRVVDNLSSGRREHLPQREPRLELVEAPVENFESTRKALAGVECVFHQAALASVPRSVTHPFESHAAGATATLTLLEAARLAGVERVVYAASSSAYGDQIYAAKREVDPPAPLSTYAATKLAGEFYCQAFYRTHGLPTLCLRYFNVFGPRQDPNSPYSAVIPVFITRMLAGQPPIVFGDGGQSRDFTYVENVVRGNLLAAHALAECVAGAAGGVFNLATGRSITLLALIDALNRELGLHVAAQFDPPRPADVRDSLADITQARRVLGFEPTVDWEEGLRRSITYYRGLCVPS